ncbi:hypothetical protein MMC07_004480 [Pseudocyphellaria aurata]|nr:hypothetical protein [Pseudocyphellaria aurata]
MPVTVRPSDRQAEPISVDERSLAKEPLTLLELACKNEQQRCSEPLQSSFDGFPHHIGPSSNGFVHGTIEAYNNHHHLKLRPEDIWFAILNQLSFYINSHAEAMRGKFVAHKGKKELVVKLDISHPHLVDYGLFAELMSNEIDSNVVDPELKEWAMPGFTTTNDHDKVVASVLLMGSLQEYFGYTCSLRCGLPSVTLLGVKADWEKILRRLDKLREFGNEPTQFRALLKPVILRFIRSFDEPNSEEVKNFWNRIADRCAQQSGPEYYSGWISAFCFWNLDGRISYLKHDPNRNGNEYSRGRSPNPQEPLSLDGVVYNAVSSKDVPPGYSSVPFKIDDFGNMIDALMVAGSVGLRYTKTISMRHEDTISPLTAWWAFTTKPDEKTTKQNTSPDPAARYRMPGSWV